jgi:hypothetical protein
MGRILRISAIVVFTLIIGASSTAFVGYQATQKEPEFYRQALQSEPLVQPTAGDDLEKAALDLHNDSQQAGSWQAVFTEEQINGWLAVDLQEKFPGVLPREIVDPRIAIEPERALIGCRYDDGRFQTVVSLALEVHLTEEPNTLAVRVCHVHAGVLPVPVTGFLDRITSVARQGRVPLRWGQASGDPVALVTIPVQHQNYAHREIYLESVELRDGEILFAGRTEKLREATSLAQHPSDNQGSEKAIVHR